MAKIGSLQWMNDVEGKIEILAKQAASVKMYDISSSLYASAFAVARAREDNRYLVESGESHED